MGLEYQFVWILGFDRTLALNTKTPGCLFIPVPSRKEYEKRGWMVKIDPNLK